MVHRGLRVAGVVRDLWAEPAAVPPGRSRWHSTAILMLMAFGFADGLLSADVGWPAVNIPLMTCLPIVLHWRYTHTLRVTIIVSSVYVALHGAMLLAGVTSTLLNISVLAVAAYTLARWASGRDAIIGIGLTFVATAVSGSTGIFRDLSGLVGLPTVVCLFVLLGVAVRLWSSRDTARMGEARMTERNRIARELHDTIAHHVSAIAVQAQGGREVLASDPDAAGRALAIIEEQASLTLAEMRVILGVLRDQDPADRTPTPGIGDITRLAEAPGPGPKVEVTMSGDLENVSASVASALYRLTQEATTNARRHASGATLVSVEIVGSDSLLHLTVTDDGHAGSPSGAGHGISGMSERATLLGGECHAGPSPEGNGWTVIASLPRNGRRA